MTQGSQTPLRFFAVMLLNFTNHLTGTDELKWLYGMQTGEWGQSLDAAPSERQPNEKFALLKISDGVKRQTMFDLAHVDAVARSAGQCVDMFASQATFVGASRQKSCFSRVRACWVDLDFHQDGRLLDSALVRDIRRHCDQLGLPQPSLVISSGRGAYLKWVLQRSVTDLPAWEAAQSMLVLLFQPFVADKMARDASRVFRILGSVNAKARDDERREVRAVDGTGQEVLFELLAQALDEARLQIDLPQVLSSASTLSSANTVADPVRRPRSNTLNRWSERLLHAAERGSPEELSLYARLREPIMQSGKFTNASLGWTRFCDLRNLYIARGGIPVGQRDITMFWMMNCLGHAGIVTPQSFDAEVRALLSAFPQGREPYEPLQDGSLQTLRRRLIRTNDLRQDIKQGKVDLSTASVDASKLLYRPSNQYLIEAFEINQEEQKQLKTLISPHEKRRRADATAPGRSERRDRREQVRARVQRWMQEHGGVCENISALARELGEEVARVWRAVKSCVREHCTHKRGTSAPTSSDHDRNTHESQGQGAPSKPNDGRTRRGSAALAKCGQWLAPACDFALFVVGRWGTKRRSGGTSGGTQRSMGGAPADDGYPTQRKSILGSYGKRHEQSLAALRLATAKPKPAGFKHWMTAFTKDISDYYRAHGAWPDPQQRQTLMEWHQANHRAQFAKRTAQQGSPPHQDRDTHQAEKPAFMTDLTSNASRGGKFIPSKTLFVMHYGEEGALRWESMGAVDKLRSMIAMEQDIWEQAKQSARSLSSEIKERWQRMVQKDRAAIDEAQSAEAAQRSQKISKALSLLSQAWQRKHGAGAVSEPA